MAREYNFYRALMAHRQGPQTSHRLFVLFLATTIASAVGLGWLGWRMIEQDRALESTTAGCFLARPERLELPTYWFEASRSIHLSYGRARAIISARLSNSSPDRLTELAPAPVDLLLPHNERSANHRISRARD